MCRDIVKLLVGFRGFCRFICMFVLLFVVFMHLAFMQCFCEVICVFWFVFVWVIVFWYEVFSCSFGLVSDVVSKSIWVSFLVRSWSLFVWCVGFWVSCFLVMSWLKLYVRILFLWVLKSESISLCRYDWPILWL